MVSSIHSVECAFNKNKNLWDICQDDDCAVFRMYLWVYFPNIIFSYDSTIIVSIKISP